jgi:predicted DNA-binding protein
MTAAKNQRINARLPSDLAKKVAYLQKRTRKSTTEIVVESIERYYDALNDAASTGADLIERSGFVGCAKAAPDLSGTYKSDLARSLGKKT